MRENLRQNIFNPDFHYFGENEDILKEREKSTERSPYILISGVAHKYDEDLTLHLATTSKPPIKIELALSESTKHIIQKKKFILKTYIQAQ
jgi:hypothetical protein